MIHSKKHILKLKLMIGLSSLQINLQNYWLDNKRKLISKYTQNLSAYKIRKRVLQRVYPLYHVISTAEAAPLRNVLGFVSISLADIDAKVWAVVVAWLKGELQCVVSAQRGNDSNV